MDTIPANTSTTEVLAVGGSRTSTIDTLGDRDWFRSTVTSGFTYEVTLGGTGTATELARVEYFAYNSSGTQFQNVADADFNGFELGSFTATTDGTVFIAATGYNDGYTGDYLLTLGTDDVRNNTATTKTIAPGGSVSGTIGAFGDRDWYRVTLDGDFSYSIRMEGTGSSTELARPEYFVRDAAGNELANLADADFNGIAGANFKAPTDGVYYISATGYNDDYKGDYTLTVGTDDFRDSSATQSTIAPGQTITASIDGIGDRDWHKITLDADFSYRITMEGTGTTSELNRPEYFVRDAAGNVVQNLADSDFNGIAGANFKAPTDGVYYITATGYNDGHQGDYTLSVGTDDYRASTDTQGTIAPGGTVTATIDGVGDRDWFEVTLEADFSYYVLMQGTGTSAELSRPEYFVRNAAGTMVQNIADNDANGVTGSIFTPTVAGTYYITATGYNDGVAGDYTLSVGTDEARNTVATEQDIAVGQARTGVIGGNGDRDWYGITLISGTDYTIKLEGDGSASELSRVEYFVYDSAGNQLQNRADSDADGVTTGIYTPGATGNYYISATGYNDGHTGTYILSVAGDRPVSTGSNQDDVLVGDGADENFNGLGGDDTIVAGGGSDVVFGGTGEDILIGGLGNDTLDGGDDVDSIFGNDGNDALIGGDGGDRLFGGAGIDAADYRTSTSGVRVDLQFTGLNNGFAVGDRYDSIEDLRGSTSADDLRGDSGNNRLYGLQGNDLLSGRDGNDILVGNAGNDVFNGGAGGDLFFGGIGVDLVLYRDATSGVNVDMLTPSFNTGEAAGDTFNGVENIRGSAFNDQIRGDNVANRLDGSGGTDFIIGRGGDDVLLGGDGNDVLTGGLGADILIGGSGIDTAQYRFATAAVKADLQFSGLNTGEAAGDKYFGIETLVGSNLGDQLRGDSVGNRIEGQNGSDIIVGRGGNDTILGDGGNDVIFGGNGSDTLTGGTGNDFFSFSAPSEGVDTITDFSRSDDLIRLDDGGFTSLSMGMLSAANFRDGATAFDANDYILYDGTSVRYDADGNGAGASVVIAIIQNSAALDETDFLIV